MRPQTIEDTIAAVSTPPGEGGIGIVRISGGEAIALASTIFVSSKGRDIMRTRGRVFHGTVHDGASVLDEVLLHVMRAPHSYTREDVVEINCHGGMGPLNAVLEVVLRSGARLAEPGEFTKRAFLNGRIDLVQAEAVIDRIRAQSRAGLQAAAAAAGGVLSKSIYEIRDSLLKAKAHIEAAVDFPDQDVPELITPALRSDIEAARGRMKSLLDTAEAGRVYREGARVAIAGRPNVGKSTLFNALLRENRALVASSPGTTRDLLEETAVIQGIPVRLSDMAGIRATDDEVEGLGVQLARETLGQVALAIVVYDGTEELTSEDLAIEEEIRELEVPAVKVLNKVDGISEYWKAHCGPEWLRISALKGEGLEMLEAELGRQLLGGAHISPDQGALTRVHQRDSLRRALDHLDRLLAGFEASPEFLSMDLGDALKALGEITGETTPDEVLDHIFSTFCLGK